MAELPLPGASDSCLLLAAVVQGVVDDLLGVSHGLEVPWGRVRLEEGLALLQCDSRDSGFRHGIRKLVLNTFDQATRSSLTGVIESVFDYQAGKGELDIGRVEAAARELLKLERRALWKYSHDRL